MLLTADGENDLGCRQRKSASITSAVCPDESGRPTAKIMIITRIREPSGTNAKTEVRDHGFPKEADMAGLSISLNH